MPKAVLKHSFSLVFFFFVIQFSDTCYPEGLFSVQDIYAYHCSGFGQEIGGTQERIQKIQKGVATTLASYIDTFISLRIH